MKSAIQKMKWGSAIERWMQIWQRVRWGTVGLVFAMPCWVWAGGVGTTTAQFLKIGVGARALAMGSAYVAVADEAHALYWNPAGVAQMERPQVVSSYNNLYQDTSHGYIAYAHPTHVGVIGGGINYLQVAAIQARLGDTATPDYYFTSRDSELFLSYARPNTFIDNLSLGANIKYITSKLDSATANAYAGDFGALYKYPHRDLNFGLSVVNVGTQMKYVSVADPLPLGLKAGLSCGLIEKKLLAAASVDHWIIDRRTYENFGLEWKPVNLIAIRGGYQFGHKQDQLNSSWLGVTGGMGIHFKSIDVDYAYIPFGDLGNTQRFSLGFKFGTAEEEPSSPKRMEK